MLLLLLLLLLAPGAEDVLGPVLVSKGKAGRVPVETVPTKASAAVPHEARQHRPANRRILPAALLLLLLAVATVWSCRCGMLLAG